MNRTKFDRIKCGSEFWVEDLHHTGPSNPEPGSPCRLVIEDQDSCVIGTANDIEEAEQLIAAIQAWVDWAKEVNQ